MLAAGRFFNNLLVDGELRASWWLEREGRRTATLAIRSAGALDEHDHAAVAAEAERMLAFAAPEAATRTVRFEPPV